jgi:hypothetical protein
VKPISSKVKFGLILLVIAGVIYLFISVIAPPLFTHAPQKLMSKSSSIVQTVQVEIVPLFDTIMKMYDKLLVAIASTVSTVVLIKDRMKKSMDEKPVEKKPKKSRFY